ncbi:MAG: Omp28-related outer membrane protein [Bacteroidia bacterium]|nr:Omp28-related outer membrane protein [Bacteroidia bacterium]
MKLLRLFPFFLLLAGCDIIEAPYLDNPISALPADEQCVELAMQTEPFQQPIVRKVLVEEMTGHQCGNCPEIGEIIHSLKGGIFANKMVVMSIHAGALSNPKSTGDKYNTDFRTDPGRDLYNALNPFDVVPLGMVDRRDKIIGAGAYQSRIQQALDLAPEAGIRVFNCYNPDSLRLTTVIDVKYLVEGGENDQLAVYLIEDNIKDWQKDYRYADPDLQGYTHHDMLRAAINGTWGEPISTGPISPDSRFTKSYSFTLKAGWAPENCKVVAFLFDNDSKEVRQVEEAPVVN